MSSEPKNPEYYSLLASEPLPAWFLKIIDGLDPKDGPITITMTEIDRQIQEAVLAEREACALLADEIDDSIASAIAERIRFRPRHWKDVPEPERQY